MKWLQIRLNEFSLKLDWKISLISKSAFVQAKNKLSHEIFKVLNKEEIINKYYDKKENPAWYKTWKNFRVLATDWSQIRLPEEKEIQDKYGSTRIKNKKEIWKYTHWLLSVTYDPLNNLAIDTILENWKYSERAWAIQNIMNIDNKNEIKDILLYDRWYYSLFIVGVINSYNKDFIFRLSRWKCKEANELFEKEGKITEKIITLKINNESWEFEEKYGIKFNNKIQEEIQVRLVKIKLDTWEIEVLLTSLIEEKYRLEDFKELYFKRWKIEVFYNILKNRLWLENFTWKNEESVLQDLYSTIFLSNLETILTTTTNEELKEKSEERNLKNQQKVNKQVSFNIIKNRVIELFLSKWNSKKVMEEILCIFKTDTVQEREWRFNLRKKNTANNSLNYNKRKKKNCF